MINIKMLTKNQYNMLTDIWMCNTQQDLEDYYSKLSSKNKDLANTLVLLLKIEQIDLEFNKHCDITEAKTIIEHIMNK